ncbi:MAG: hypothetical protein ABL890_00465 [Candidatus Peribacteraceae bacterium]
MYTDFIQYKLASGVTEAMLQAAAKDVHAQWMSKQPGFISWEINLLGEEKGYMDIVRWESKDAAKNAEANMKDLPPDSPWFKCYDMTSIVSVNGTSVSKLQ